MRLSLPNLSTLHQTRTDNLNYGTGVDITAPNLGVKDLLEIQPEVSMRWQASSPPQSQCKC